MYRSLNKFHLKKIIKREFEIRMKGIEIPEFEISFEPECNLITIYGYRCDASDRFIEQLRRQKLLIRADDRFFFINSDLLLKLFFCKYQVNSDCIDFYKVTEFGLVDFIFEKTVEGSLIQFKTAAGNFLHAYVKALLNPVFGHLVNEVDLSDIEVVC